MGLQMAFPHEGFLCRTLGLDHFERKTIDMLGLNRFEINIEIATSWRTREIGESFG